MILCGPRSHVLSTTHLYGGRICHGAHYFSCGLVMDPIKWEHTSSHARKAARIMWSFVWAWGRPLSITLCRICMLDFFLIRHSNIECCLVLYIFFPKLYYVDNTFYENFEMSFVMVDVCFNSPFGTTGKKEIREAATSP